MTTNSPELLTDDVNKSFWEATVSEHVKSSSYRVEEFLNNSKALTLGADDIRLVGDVKALKLLHIQCHFGLDTLSWARLGAVVMGLDFSERAIKQARILACKSRIEASFEVSCVKDLTKSPNISQFDIAIASWGVLDWIEDLSAYFQGIRSCLSCGGKFYLAEVHPVAKWLLDKKSDPGSVYCNRRLTERGISYATGKTIVPIIEVWRHTLDSIITAISQSGFQINIVEEHTSSSYRFHKDLVRMENNRWEWPKLITGTPLSCHVCAVAI